jgi:DNA-binding NarL/FixJ family response regulator
LLALGTFLSPKENHYRFQRFGQFQESMMIAYRAIEPDLAGIVAYDETEFTRGDTEAGHSENSAPTPASPPTAPGIDAPLIAIVDPRTLGRDSLAVALGTMESRFRHHTFAHLDEWLQDEQVHKVTAAILLGIGSTDADDPGLAEDLRFLARDFSHIPVVVMGDIEAPTHVIAILGHGARGYIPTSVNLSIAIEAISLARAGGLFVPASCLKQLQQMPSQPAQAAPAEEPLLTERQAAVAQAVARGKANKIIAYELNLCESTVKVHIRSIMKKLKARNRTEVAFKLHTLAPSQVRSAPGWRSIGTPVDRKESH